MQNSNCVEATEAEVEGSTHRVNRKTGSGLYRDYGSPTVRSSTVFARKWNVCLIAEVEAVCALIAEGRRADTSFLISTVQS